MSTKTTFVCDICNEVKDGMTPYVIQSEGRMARVDLCPTDGAMLERLLEAGATSAHADPGADDLRRRRIRAPRYEGYIPTIDEIEKLTVIDGGRS